MKILQIIKSRNFAGSEQYMITLCRILRRRGHECTVAIIPGGRLEAVCQEEGIKIAPVSSSAIWATRRLYVWAKNNGVDIVHTHLTGGARIGLWVARAMDIPCFAHLHIYRADKAYANVAQYSRGSLIAVSEHVARYYEDNLHLRTYSVPVIINATVAHENTDASRSKTELAAELRVELGLSENSRLLLLAGRLSTGKGQDVMICAMSSVLAVHPDSHLLLAGVAKRGSSAEGDLLRMVKSLGVESRVHFLGFRRDMVRLMRAAELVIVPSRTDVMPLVVIEAMMLGSCVIASNVCGIPEIITDAETGVLVRPDNAASLGSAVIRLLDNPTLSARIACDAGAYARKEFDPELMAKKIENLYYSYSRVKEQTNCYE